ncbi:unnamed protein product, partial [Plutella xylostella]
TCIFFCISSSSDLNSSGASCGVGALSAAARSAMRDTAS